jgi:hypothetical protein
MIRGEVIAICASDFSIGLVVGLTIAAVRLSCSLHCLSR